ncbi:hypothetical protein [Aestuariibacter sp. A3R04]|uniref:hypothetical protein n=1 Tax=Aestuariibacter sp. A3R04 TaxID=2841571 RepID=UPI001C0A3D90|nr:hypothetical protein [Aestuariibacter sp. A3R04]MBU3020468.1 hypothetical protein [Aestuariibacter sp. A3R04]
MAGRQRVRGVKASRQKLERAMAEKGFETQIQLARYMAKIEKRTSPPKDLVNKVFREQPVAFHNISRIAIALDVEAHTLFFSASDTPMCDLLSQQAPAKHQSSFAAQLISKLRGC